MSVFSPVSSAAVDSSTSGAGAGGGGGTGGHVGCAAEALDWSSLAGNAEAAAALEGFLLRALRYPDVYDAVAARTRARFESNRPRAVLFAGPPGGCIGARCSGAGGRPSSCGRAVERAGGRASGRAGGLADSVGLQRLH